MPVRKVCAQAIRRIGQGEGVVGVFHAFPSLLCQTSLYLFPPTSPPLISTCYRQMTPRHDTFLGPKAHYPSPVPNSRHRLSTRRRSIHRLEHHFRPAPIFYDYVQERHDQNAVSKAQSPWLDARNRCGWEISPPFQSTRLGTAFAHMERQPPSAAPGRREYLSASRRTSHTCRPATMLASCVRPQAPSLHHRRYSATCHAPPVESLPRRTTLHSSTGISWTQYQGAAISPTRRRGIIPRPPAPDT
jgi:hypothetical protein